MPNKKPGFITWTDLTVKDAPKVRTFYEKVVGWTSEGLDCGGYDDYCMKAGRKTVAGVCHARGPNKNLPAVWLVYITVKSLARSLKQVKKHGGKLVQRPRDMGIGRMAVIQDPAGACAALFEWKA